MCAEYEIRTSKKRIEDALDRSLSNEIDHEVFEHRVKLSLKTPIIIESKDKPVLVPSTFPVNPFPNARLSGADHYSVG